MHNLDNMKTTTTHEHETIEMQHYTTEDEDDDNGTECCDTSDEQQPQLHNIKSQVDTIVTTKHTPQGFNNNHKISFEYKDREYSLRGWKALMFETVTLGLVGVAIVTNTSSVIQWGSILSKYNFFNK